MTRIGKAPITLMEGVSVAVKEGIVCVKGQQGALEHYVPPPFSVEVSGNKLSITCQKKGTSYRALWGLHRSLLSNLVTGVTQGFTQELELRGTGYRATVKGERLVLQIGLSHPVHFLIPSEVDMTCSKETQIVIKGINKQQVGQLAANIRAFSKPEPYKGKGIRYKGEYVRRKEGKKK